MFRIIIIFFTVCTFSFAANEWQEVRDMSEFNTTKDEFAPRLTPDGTTIIYNSNSSKYSKFYFSNYNGTTFSAPQLLKGDLNKDRNNQSYICFLDEFSGYYSTFKQLKKKPVMKLYSFKANYGQFVQGKELEILQEEKFTSHPTISKSGKSMVFVSENILTHKTDLYQVSRENSGLWSEPKQILELTSEGNEITPFLQTDDTLYFATDGFGGKGGYDIFQSIRLDGMWQRPVPLNYLNTEFDESDFAIIGMNKAIYSSNKSGGKGGLDLYLAQNMNLKSNATAKLNIQSIKIEEESLKLNLRRGRIRIAFNFYSDYNIKGATDQFYEQNSLKVLGNYLNDNKNEKLTLSIRVLYKPELDSSRNSKFLADTKANFIKEYLTKVCKIDEERIDFQYNYTDNLQDQTIYMKLVNPLNLYNYINNDTLDIQPNKLHITMNPDEIDDYQFTSNFSNEKRILKYEKVSNGIVLDLVPIQARLDESDSLKISIVNISTSATKDFTLDIIANKKINTFTQLIDGNLYDIYPFYFKTYADCQEIDLTKQIKKLAQGRDIILASEKAESNTSFAISEQIFADMKKSIPNVRFVTSDLQIDMKAQSVIYLFVAR